MEIKKSTKEKQRKSMKPKAGSLKKRKNKIDKYLVILAKKKRYKLPALGKKRRLLL